MKPADRFRLLGTYRTPRVRIGSAVACEARDCDLVVVEISDARIPWPIGRPRGHSAKSLIVFGDLARAVRTESNQAVCYWFGVVPSTVSKWRKSLCVGLTNPGTHRLRSEYCDEPWAKKARKKAHAKARDPERCRKIAESRRGKPRPAHVVEIIRRTHTGRKPLAATRAKMAAAMRERATTFVPNGRAWTPEKDELVRQLPVAEVGRRTGRTPRSIYARRIVLKVPDGRRR